MSRVASRAVNSTLLKALVGLVPVAGLLAWSVSVFSKRKSLGSSLQLLGAACLVIVVLTHISEGLRLFPSMGWGEAHSIGHYLNLLSAVLGIALLPLGYVFHARAKRTPW